MRIFLSFVSGLIVLSVLFFGNGIFAQERKPIPETPLPPTGESESEAQSAPGAEPQPVGEFTVATGIAAEGLNTGGSAGVEVVEYETRKADEVIDIKDTLFAPAEAAEGVGVFELLPPVADEPVDASMLGVAAGAPKDDQLELMQVYEGLRQFDNGIAAAGLVLKRDPQNKEALAGMVRLMVEAGRADEALDYSSKLLELDPAAGSQALRASALMSAARAEEAEALLLEMKARHPGPAKFPYETLLGFAMLDQAKRKEARAIFEAVGTGEGYDAMEVDTASKQLLLMDLDHAVQWRDVGAAKESVAKLRKDYAGEPETAAAEAVEQFLDGSVAEAAARLGALRSEFPRLRLYPFLLQLADFSYVAGDFSTAEAAYAEALGDRRTRPHDREAVVRNRAQMRIREGEQASVDLGVVDGEEGSLATSTGRLRKAVGENWYLGGEITRQDVNLDAAGAVRAADDRLEGLLVAERRLEKGRYAEVKLGGSDAGVAGAVTVGKRARVYSDAWSVGVAANERANDSAQLAGLDGRQHRVSAMVQREINPRLVITAEAIARQVEIDGAKLGNGAGIDVDLAYRLNEEERRSNFYIAWRSAYAKFDRSGSFTPRGSGYDAAAVAELGVDQVVAGLVQPDYSRHGVEVRHEGQWRENLFTRAMAGLYYRSDSSDVEASGGVGLDWFVTEEMRLFFDALYTTGGRAGNAGAGVAEAKLGVAKSF